MSAIAQESYVSIGRLDAASGVEICLPPEKVFGRHAGIFGATGGADGSDSSSGAVVSNAAA